MIPSKGIQKNMLRCFDNNLQNIFRVTRLRTAPDRSFWMSRILPKLHPDAYSEPCLIFENLRIFRILIYLKPDKYLEPSKRFKMEIFAKIAKNYNYFSKALHLRSLTGLWIRPSLNKYPLTCRVTSRYILYDTYSEPCLLL